MPRTKRTMALQCPRDRAALVEEEHEIPGFNVWADHCPKCAGVFLDKDELARLTGASNINRQVTKALGIDADSQLVCPACGGLMDEETFANVTIDVCLTCQGIWLDAGELDAIGALDDKAFKALSPAKQAELFDQKRSALRSPLFGGLGMFSRGRKR
ncbi:MAG TPA: zf-TFIIB domain-containing protein [Candidatus Thermoplasmatota archaeon]|nr:zf-TFIIB domain-containing protein [Candidatus Thermoplasmatota archaeon]